MTSRREVTVASVQMDVTIGDVAGTLARIGRWVDRAAAKGADIVLLPELIMSAGYSLGDEFYDVAETVPGPSTEALGRKAREHQLYVVAGIAERDDTGTVFNSAVIIGRDGGVAGSYRKTHIFPATESFFALGSDLPVFDLDFGRVAIPICYDLEFPEPGRILCLKGAELLLSMAAHWIGTGTVGTPANFITTIYAARALENRVPVALSNRVGFDPGLNDKFVGLSRIVDADGMTVASMSDDSEGMITATFDLEEQRRKRRSYNYFRDRKPRLYGPLVESDATRRSI
jgi:predicted amidohydrolase